MSICEKLRNGQNTICINPAKKYYQQVVLVNRSDVNNSRIVTSGIDIDDNYQCRNRVYFDLKEDKTGYRFTTFESGMTVFGLYEKTVVNGIPQYSHSVNIVLVGVDEDVKCLLKQLDSGDYFAALQYYDGSIEIFGFEFGLTTSNYSYDPANLGGGAIIKLNSMPDSLEDEPPFVYKTQTPNLEITDFDNNFVGVVYDINGDFNDDFNFDFNSD
jgi:hypothetical protein